MRFKLKGIYLFTFFLLASCAFAQTIIYSEKFRIDTTRESSLISVPVRIRNVNSLYGFKFDIKRISYVSIIQQIYNKH